MRTRVLAVIVAVACGGVRTAAAAHAPAAPATAPAARLRLAAALFHGAGPISCRICQDRARCAQATWSAKSGRPARSTGTTTTRRRRSPRSAVRSSRIVADTGTRVKAGDPLLYVASGDMTNAVSTVPQGQEPHNLAKHQLDRNKDLFDHKALSARDYEAAQADYNDAATDVAGALQTLKVFGVRQATSPTRSSRTCRSGRRW